MTYVPPLFFKNGHIQSIYPTLFRKVNDVELTRERIDTDDDDFIDLEWARKNHSRLIIVSHGLEGSTKSHYGLGIARAGNANGWDSLLWNFQNLAQKT